MVELVNKLQELGLLGSDLLHSINGREYITPDCLCQEVKQAVSQAGGRVAVVGPLCPAQLFRAANFFQGSSHELG